MKTRGEIKHLLLNYARKTEKRFWRKHEILVRDKRKEIVATERNIFVMLDLVVLY